MSIFFACANEDVKGGYAHAKMRRKIIRQTIQNKEQPEMNLKMRQRITKGSTFAFSFTREKVHPSKLSYRKIDEVESRVLSIAQMYTFSYGCRRM